MKLSVSASRGGNAKTVLSFAFGVEGSAGGTPCPHASALRLRGTGKAAKSADFRLPGIPKIHCILVPVCYPALAFLTVKNTEKVNPDLLFALPECLPSETKKAVMRPPSRCQSVVRGKRQKGTLSSEAGPAGGSCSLADEEVSAGAPPADWVPEASADGA